MFTQREMAKVKQRGNLVSPDLQKDIFQNADVQNTKAHF